MTPPCDALRLAREHVDAQGVFDEAYPECKHCNNLMEISDESAASAFCASCIYEVADTISAALLAQVDQMKKMQTVYEAACAWALTSNPTEGDKALDAILKALSNSIEAP